MEQEVLLETSQENALMLIPSPRLGSSKALQRVFNINHVRSPAGLFNSKHMQVLCWRGALVTCATKALKSEAFSHMRWEV